MSLKVLAYSILSQMYDKDTPEVGFVNQLIWCNLDLIQLSVDQDLRGQTEFGTYIPYLELLCTKNLILGKVSLT